MGSGEILPGDWTCQDCDVNNFARRTRCMDCDKPKNSVIDAKEYSVDEDPEKYELDGKEEEDKARSQEVREGDWVCASCSVNNFARRQACFKCKAHRDGTGFDDKYEYRSGDWSCSACGTHNFARRSACFQCRKQRPDQGNDWMCMNCNMNNFARRAYCFGCQAPKYASDRDSNRYSNPYYNNSGPPPPNDSYYARGPPPPRQGGMGGRNPVRNGDWMCARCGFHNFAWRDSCKGCGEQKQEGNIVQDRRQGVQPGDWTCDSCGENNWRRRTKCYKCENPKPLIPEEDD